MYLARLHACYHNVGMDGKRRVLQEELGLTLCQNASLIYIPCSPTSHLQFLGWSKDILIEYRFLDDCIRPVHLHTCLPSHILQTIIILMPIILSH